MMEMAATVEAQNTPTYVRIAIDLDVASFGSMYIRQFHYPEDHGGMKPEELSPFAGPKSKISEKLDPN